MLKLIWSILKDQSGKIGGSESGGSGKSITYGGATTPGANQAQDIGIRNQLQAEQQFNAYDQGPQSQLDQLIGLMSKGGLAQFLGGGMIATPQQQQQIDQAYNAQRVEGLRDIDTQFNNDALARGLSTTDSPIANAKALALGEFSRGLASNKAQAGLNLGFQNAGFNQNLASYQDQLRQQAALNRMGVLQGYGNPNLQFSLGQSSLNRTVRGNQSGQGTNYGLDLGSAAGGLGGAVLNSGLFSGGGGGGGSFTGGGDAGGFL